MKFKSGDKVRCVFTDWLSDGSLKRGNVYTVSRIENWNMGRIDDYRVILKETPDRKWREFRFELANRLPGWF